MHGARACGQSPQMKPAARGRLSEKYEQFLQSKRASGEAFSQHRNAVRSSTYSFQQLHFPVLNVFICCLGRVDMPECAWPAAFLQSASEVTNRIPASAE
jgi:hypothetical protein